MSKLLYVTGPSLSGKTRLTSIITSYLMRYGVNVSNISFEILYNTITDNYESLFYKLVNDRLSKNKDLVIAESVLFNSMPNQESLEILCWPDEDDHIKQYDNYISKFGGHDAKRRIYYDSIPIARDKFIKTYTYSKARDRIVCYSDDDLENICKKVLEYVKA